MKTINKTDEKGRPSRGGILTAKDGKDLSQIQAEWQKDKKYLDSIYATAYYNFAKTHGAVPDPHKHKAGFVKYMSELNKYTDGVIIDLYNKDSRLRSSASAKFIKPIASDSQTEFGVPLNDLKRTNKLIQKQFSVDKDYLSLNVIKNQDGTMGVITGGAKDKYNFDDPLVNIAGTDRKRLGGGLVPARQVDASKGQVQSVIANRTGTKPDATMPRIVKQTIKPAPAIDKINKVNTNMPDAINKSRPAPEKIKSTPELTMKDKVFIAQLYRSGKLTLEQAIKRGVSEEFLKNYKG